MIRQYRSRAMASIHETAEGPHAAGVMDKQTMRKFDKACLTPVRPLMAAEIRALREREGASQAVFARYLNVTTGLMSQWERGEKHPQGSSLKLLSLWRKTGWEPSPDCAVSTFRRKCRRRFQYVKSAWFHTRQLTRSLRRSRLDVFSCEGFSHSGNSALLQ